MGFRCRRRSRTSSAFAAAIRGEVDLREGDVGVLELGVLLEEPRQETNRVVGLASGHEHEGQVVGGLAVVGPLGERLPEVRLRAVEVALAAEDEAEVVQGLGKIGLELQGLLVELAGLLLPARLEERVAQVVERVG